MALFEIPKTTKSTNKTTSSSIKLKKGQTIDDLIIAARKLVEEKLGKYKDTSKCVTDIKTLTKFFDDTPNDSVVGIDTETTGLNFLTDELVGISLCNGIDAIYVPINHKSSTFRTRLTNQISPDEIKQLFKQVFSTKTYKWIYHNAKFDLAVLRTFLGYPMPDPYWDTMLGRTIIISRRGSQLKILIQQICCTRG